MDVSIIIINFRTPELTKHAVEAVHSSLSTANITYEVIVIDNFSGDDSYKTLLQLADDKTKVLETEKNGGFAYGNNFGAKFASGRYLFFLNSDTILYPDVLPEMIAYMDEHKDTGVMSCLMEDGNKIPLVVSHPFENAKTLFIQAVIKPLVPQSLQELRRENYYTDDESLVSDCDWVSGAALLISRTLFDEIGGWDESYFMYMEDEELCWQAEKDGFKVQLYHKLGLQHLVGKSGGSKFVAEERNKSRLHFFEHKTPEQMWIIRPLLKIMEKNEEVRR